MTFNWNNDLIFKLIKLYHERSVLWDISLDDYKDKNKKNEAWLEIARYLNTDRDVVERKMKILSTQFRREYTKNLKFDADGNEVSQWFAFKKLLFLKSRIAGKDTSAAMQDSDSESSVAASVEPIKKKKKFKPQSHQRETTAPGPLLTTTRDPLEPSPSKDHAATVREDEFDTFGRHVANQLRTLPLSNAIICQNFINNYLSEERLKVINEERSLASSPAFSNSLVKTEVTFDSSSN